MKKMIEKQTSRKIQAQERRLQILDTALTVFAEKGFTKTTIKDIADAVGISSGLLYHYFTSKEELLGMAIELYSYLPQLRDILENTGDQPYREVLKSIAIGFMDVLEEKNVVMKIFLQEGSINPSVRQVWSKMANEGVSILQAYFSERIAAGELKDHNAEITARCLFYNLAMFDFTRDIFKDSKVTKMQFVENMIDSLLNGIQKQA